VFSAVISETDLRDVCQADTSTELRCVLVSGNFFTELGAKPLYGRVLNEQDDQPGAQAVALLGYDYWQSRFGGDPSVVLRLIRLNDRPVQVVGVASPEFGGLGKHAQVWLANSQYPYLTGDSRVAEDNGRRGSWLYGRLKPGTSPAAAEAQLETLTASHERVILRPPGLPPNRTAGAILLVSTCALLVLLVLFSACANLGNMLLARGIARRREMEIRLSVGAGPWRLVRQLMTENLLLAALATIAAIFVGRVAAFILLRAAGAPSNMRVVTDWRIVLGAAALGVGATLAFGLAPALQIVRRGPAATRARKILVSVQVTASCVLLVLSSFLTRAVQESFHTSLSVDASTIAVVEPNFRIHRFGPARAGGTVVELAVRLRQAPGVEGASIVTSPPLRRPHVEPYGGNPLYTNGVDPSYFATMRLTLLAGRGFAAEEEGVAVIAESAARKLWPNRSPLGRSIRVAGSSRTVVGIVKDSGVNLLTDPRSVEVYTPIGEWDAVDAAILVRTKKHAAAMSESIRSAASAPGITPMVFTLQYLTAQHFDPTRKMVATVGALAATASLLALLGIFGLLAFTVAQRTREIGIRMALGARKRDILRLILGQYAVPFGAGAGMGVALAAGAAKIMRGAIYGLIPVDLFSLGAGLLLFAAVAAAATIVPARRALRVDPATAIRYE
jgi:predicted permease